MIGGRWPLRGECSLSPRLHKACDNSKPTVAGGHDAVHPLPEHGFLSGAALMAIHRRLEVSEVGDVTVVRFVDRKILDEGNIQEIGQELFDLVEKEKRKKLLLNFGTVDFLSSAALGKLITLDKKSKTAGAKLKLSNIRPEIYEVFLLTHLYKLFDIKDDEAEALAAF
jgi:anti-sigma B factor antagonist